MQKYKGVFLFITFLVYYGSETILDFIVYMIIPLAIYFVLYVQNKQDEEFEYSINKRVSEEVDSVKNTSEFFYETIELPSSGNIPMNIERIEKTLWMEKLWEWADAHNIGEDKLPKTAIGLVTLLNLDLSHKEIKELPDEIGNLIYLDSLDLSNNDLKSLPKTMDQLVYLSTLRLSYNFFTRTPKLLARLPNIRILALDNNKIKKQSAEIEAFNFLAGDIAHRLAGVRIEDEANLLNRAKEETWKRDLPHPKEIPSFPTNELITS